jgi:hypothetical protein
MSQGSQSPANIEKSRQEHQASTRSVAIASTGLFYFFVLILIGVYVGPGHDLLISRNIDPNVPGVIAGLLAAGSGAAAFWSMYNSQPIPNEPLRAPEPFELIADQRWRPLTSPQLRFLERLKKEVTDTEREIQRAHDSAVKAYNSIPQAVSYAAYQSAKRELSLQESGKKHLLERLPPLYERIGKIFGGDVGSEILALKERIKKLERKKLEEERRLATWQAECTIPHKYQNDVNECEQARARQRERLHEAIHALDRSIIEKQSDLEELQNYDFRQLWKDAGLRFPATEGITRVAADSLKELKDKIETLNSIPDLAPRQHSAQATTPEEQRQQNLAKAQARLKRHEQNKVQELNDIIGGLRFDQLSSGKQDEYKEAENEWNDRILKDRQEVRKYK